MGRPRKSVEELRRNGTFRADRHADRLPESNLELCFKPPPRPKTKCGDPGKWVLTAADDRAVALGCWFDEGIAEYVCEWFRKFLRHSKGRWAGQPFELLDWQRKDIVYPLFGWMRPGATRRFQRAYIEIPKKNGKSTLASGIGLYMLAGDGEHGPEVYSCATDKDQASIVHGEAINMAEASEELSAALKINRTNRNILYDSKKGAYKAVSAKPQGKEGLNGNCWIADELHAWHGDELWNTLRYMGSARSEPLGFAITTAGDDMESVCRRQHDYAQCVISGQFDGEESIRFFGYIRGLEPGDNFDTHEARAKANPSLGATINENDLIADVAEARKSPSSMASMLRYRFNVWSAGSNPWLSLDDWTACKDEFNEETLAGQTCWAGLDLAKTHDFTSLVLMFAHEEGYKQLAYYWLPEDMARERNRLAPYLVWAEGGWITLTRGNTCDYNVVEQDIVTLFQKFQVCELAYDPTYAGDLTQRIEEATGVPRVEIPQTPGNFVSPLGDYHRLVLDHKLWHNGNPVLAWQAGHAQVLSDRMTGKPVRVVKPSVNKNDHRTIDGVVAGVMALGSAIRSDGPSVYEGRGLLSL